jgi:hypothetical protein
LNEEEEQHIMGEKQQKALEEPEVRVAQQEAPEEPEAEGAQQEAPEGSSSDEGEDEGGEPHVTYRLV